MKRFLKPQEPDNSASTSQNDCDQQVTAKRPCLSGVEGTSTTEKMKMYKKNLKFNPKWKEKWCWIDYMSNEGMFCAI